MIVVEAMKRRYADEIVVSIGDPHHPLEFKRFHLPNLGQAGEYELHQFLHELRNHFGFKLEIG